MGGDIGKAATAAYTAQAVIAQEADSDRAHGGEAAAAAFAVVAAGSAVAQTDEAP